MLHHQETAQTRRLVSLASIQHPAMANINSIRTFTENLFSPTIYDLFPGCFLQITSLSMYCLLFPQQCLAFFWQCFSNFPLTVSCLFPGNAPWFHFRFSTCLCCCGSPSGVIIVITIMMIITKIILSFS